MAATSPGRLSSLARVIRPAWHSSQQLRPPPGLAEHVLREEGQHGLVPDPDVPGGQDPVVLVREVEEPDVLRPAGSEKSWPAADSSVRRSPVARLMAVTSSVTAAAA